MPRHSEPRRRVSRRLVAAIFVLGLALTLAAGLSVLPARADAEDPALPDVHRYTYVRVDFPDARIPGAMATDAQVGFAARQTTRFWDRIAGAPQLSYEVVHEVVQIRGPANPCPLCADMQAQIEDALGRPVGGLVIFLKQGYPTSHATGQAMVGEHIATMFGAFPGNASGPGWDRVAHEVGHNLGFNHDTQNASAWTPASFIPSDSYWNPYSVMGGGTQVPSGVQQARLGWLVPFPLYRGSTRQLWDISTSVCTQARLLTFVANNHTYALEYRPVATSSSPAGVVLYRDGQAAETASSVYTLPERRTYWLGDSGVGVLVSGHGLSGKLRYATVSLVHA